MSGPARAPNPRGGGVKERNGVESWRGQPDNPHTSWGCFLPSPSSPIAGPLPFLTHLNQCLASILYSASSNTQMSTLDTSLCLSGCPHLLHLFPCQYWRVMWEPLLVLTSPITGAGQLPTIAYLLCAVLVTTSWGFPNCSWNMGPTAPVTPSLLAEILAVLCSDHIVLKGREV